MSTSQNRRLVERILQANRDDPRLANCAEEQMRTAIRRATVASSTWLLDVPINVGAALPADLSPKQRSGVEQAFAALVADYREQLLVGIMFERIIRELHAD